MQAPAGLLEGPYASLVVGLLHAWLRPSGEPEGRRHTQEEAHLLRSSWRGRFGAMQDLCCRHTSGATVFQLATQAVVWR